MISDASAIEDHMRMGGIWDNGKNRVVEWFWGDKHHGNIDIRIRLVPL
jgi:hypothetical protein